MTNSSENPMDAVAGLMLERQRYEDWIATLEAKRDVTPPHVFERVFGDYTRRLAAVTDQLKGRTAELQDAISKLTARVKEVQSKERALGDERYEAELRAEVGEYTPEQWEETARKADLELQRLATDRKLATEDINRLQQILSMAASPEDTRQAGTTSTAGKAVISLVRETDAKAPDRRPSEPVPRKRQAGEQQPGFDELAFLQSVTGQKGEAARKGKQPPPPPQPPAEPRHRAPSGDVAAQPAATHDEATESPTAPPLGSGSGDGGSGRNEQQPVMRDTGPMSSILRDVPQEHVKTLKCAECSAMNYRTEWYCERCGAELATM